MEVNEKQKSFHLLESNCKWNKCHFSADGSQASPQHRVVSNRGALNRGQASGSRGGRGRAKRHS